MSFGLTFGIFTPSTTTESQKYYNEDIKNVIFMIGDGMGGNHLEKTKAEKNISLAMETVDFRGSSKTRSLSNSVTDSAAGGTALATGTRTSNGAIGVYMTDLTATFSYPKSLTELCKENGMLTGVVTTDETSGATPSAFSAHESDRGRAKEISLDQLNSDIDLIWGAENGYVTEGEAGSAGFEYVTTYEQMMALPQGSRSFAQFNNDLWTLKQSDMQTPTLKQMTMKAIDILDDTDEGFFLMVEGAHIDKHSHSNEDEKMMEAVMSFDETIDAVLEYAKNDGETLVIITADHETGGITLKGDKYVFTQGSHSSANVPVLVYGSDNFINRGEVVNNYELPIRVAYTLGFAEDQFPFEVANS
jgi:alkaline phosphatase